MLRLTCPLKRCTTKTSSSSTTKSSDDSVDATTDLSLILNSTSPSPSPSPSPSLSPLKRCISSVDDPTTLSLSPSPLRRCVNSVATPTPTTRAFDVFYRPSEGQKLEVVPFLSYSGTTKHLLRSNGDKVGFDAVLGKHLLICCVSLPITRGHHYFRSIITTYTELPRTDFEMVLVPHIKPGFPDDDSLFNSLFSRLPCLAIPFSDSQTRDYICTFIGFNRGSSYDDVSAILVDPSQTLTCCSDVIYDFYFLGSEGFPFLKSTDDAIRTQDDVLRCRLDPLSYDFYKGGNRFTANKDHPLLRVPLSLHKDILLCDPSLVLPLIGRTGVDKQQPLAVSELSDMYVGLYLCVDGGFLHRLIKVHQHCTANKQQLAFVVVCVPLFHSIEWLRKKVKRRLEQSNIAWFILPENKVWRRLWRIFGKALDLDNVVILPPNCKNGEMDGRILLDNLGVSAYPYTRSAILEQNFTTLKSVTPASIFKGTTKKSTCLVHSNGRNVRQSHLKGKKLLVYLDWLAEDSHYYSRDLELCLLLMNNYPKIQALGWEVVFVPLDDEDTGKSEAMISKMPWPVMPLSNAIETSVTSLLSLPWQLSSKHVVAFDEDGRIVTTQVDMILEDEKCGFDDSLFNDVLYKDTCDWLFSLFSLSF